MAALVCDILFYVFYCDERAGTIMNKLNVLSTILKTTRVFIDNAPLCEVACRCVRSLTSKPAQQLEQESYNTDDLCSFLVEVLKRHREDHAT